MKEFLQGIGREPVNSNAALRYTHSDRQYVVDSHINYKVNIKLDMFSN